MQPDEEILKTTGIQKITNRYQDVKKNEVKVRGKIPVNLEYEKKQTENGNSENRKNRYNTFTRSGLDEEILANSR